MQFIQTFTQHHIYVTYNTSLHCILCTLAITGTTSNRSWTLPLRPWPCPLHLPLLLKQVGRGLVQYFGHFEVLSLAYCWALLDEHEVPRTTTLILVMTEEPLTSLDVLGVGWELCEREGGGERERAREREQCFYDASYVIRSSNCTGWRSAIGLEVYGRTPGVK